MPELDAVALSRLQFALTAMYHFLFVPLTLGLVFLLAIMESIWVMTRRPIWRDMTKFWGKLFGINFAMGVATGLTMEFQFGTNWAYYSHFVGDVFGAPLALEALTAFFLESTFIGLFFFGWERLKPLGHLMVTWLLAFGSSLSAVWILMANAWMQNPVGAEMNHRSMRMELTDLWAVIFNPVAQAKFVHTVSAGYVCGAVFVLAIASWYLLRRRHVEVAKRSFTVAAAFGLASSLSVVVLGDESGYAATQNQRMKIAAIEAMWHTEPPPAGFVLFGLPDQESRTIRHEVKIPWLLGLISTRSVDKPVAGIEDLVREAERRVRTGLIAYDALQKLRQSPDDARALQDFEAHKKDFGFALLLRRQLADPRQATDGQIRAAALGTVPRVAPLFWSFRVMVALGLWFVLLFAGAVYFSTVRRFDRRWFLRLAVLTLPLPWMAIELGWFVAEYGRQPWAVYHVLPTFLGVSTVPPGEIWLSLSAFVLFYTTLLVIDLGLMVRYVRLGPGHVPETPADAERRAGAQAAVAPAPRE